MSIEKHNSREEKPQSPVLGYLEDRNKILLNDYHTPDGNYAESCGLIAADIAKMLIKDGKKPTIVSIAGKRINDPYIIANETLEPKQYEGRVSWAGHTVCVCEGLVYDPMIGKPLPIGEYAHEAFGNDVEMKTIVTEDKIEEFVNR
jgi:hypothetical protein